MSGKVKLLGFGSPILDITLEGNKHLLNKYTLKSNDQVLATGPLLDIFDEISEKYKDQLTYTPGGATLNAVKVVQWCLGTPLSTAVIGCLGNDEFGTILCTEMQKAGVQTHFEKHPTEPTGTCLAICTGTERSLVTHGGAAGCLSPDFLHKPQIQQVMEESQYFYSSGFTFVTCPSELEFIAKHASRHKEKVFTLNLAAPYVCQQYNLHILNVLPFVNVLFGNTEEFDEFASCCGLKLSTRAEIALQLSQWKMEGEHSQSRIVVITHGALPALVAWDGQVKEIPPNDNLPGPMVDTTGAGDGFVGGFLSSLMVSPNVEKAMLAGHRAAGVVLTHRGCTLPS